MNIAILPGDGVGNEVIREATQTLELLAGKFGFTLSMTPMPFGGEHYLKTSQTLPESAMKELADHDAILFGAVGVDPKGAADIPTGLLETEILLRMRFAFDQYVNLRPAVLMPGVPTPLKDAGKVDIVFVRENTEGSYVGMGGQAHRGTPHEVATQIELATRVGTERVIRHAFEYAKTHGRKKVTMVAKTNVLRFAHELWMRVFKEVAGEYPAIATDYHHVDACCMYLVTRPSSYDVIVTTNMFGDILTDLAAAVQGGMGVAASGNLNPTRQKPSMFEPVHGSAPDIAGQNKANPAAALLSAAMMLEHLDQPQAARALTSAVARALSDPTHHTADLGGKASTSQVGDAVRAAL